MKGTAPIRILSLLLLTACGAPCQNAPSTALPQESQPGAPNTAEMRAWQSLPEAPSPVQPLIQESGVSALRPEPADSTPPSEPGFTAFYQQRSTPNEFTNSFAKYLDFQMPKPDPMDARSTSTSFLGRATHAASSVLLTHSASGRPRLNTAFCLGMLTLAAAHTAYRPYWERTSGAVVGDFGVTIGSNAGINVFHEFEPAIRDKARSMTPKFVYRLEERITHDQTQRNSLSITGQ